MRSRHFAGVWLAAALLAACAGREDAPATAAIAVSVSPVNDSKCGGGLAFQTIEITNQAKESRPVMPICELNTPGLQLAETPAGPRLVAPGETARFVCIVRDVGDPPDAFAEQAVGRLVVRFGGQEQRVSFPVVCNQR